MSPSLQTSVLRLYAPLLCVARLLCGHLHIEPSFLLSVCHSSFWYHATLIKAARMPFCILPSTTTDVYHSQLENHRTSIGIYFTFLEVLECARNL